MVLNHLVKECGAEWVKDKSLGGYVAHTTMEQQPIIFYKPREYMNLNGIPISKAARALGIEPHSILIVHDELEKKLGQIALKRGGSAKGHNGLRSCIGALQSNEFGRLRVGIDRPSQKSQVADYVLSYFEPDELKVIDEQVYPLAYDFLVKLLKQELTC